MLFSLLADGDAATTPNNGWVSYALIGVLVVILVVSMILMNRRSKKREQEAQKLIDAVKPGNKVKTIGGICGIVVEVDPEEDTFVLETGSEASGKCFMKFVRQAILESDAIVKDEKKSEKPTKEKDEESAAEEDVQPASEEKPTEEKPAEEKAEEKPTEESSGLPQPPRRGL